MNLQQLIYEIAELGVGSQRLQSDYVRFLNRAQRTICQRNNWAFMASRITATIPAGQTSVALPATFKTLQPEKSAVTYADSSGRPIPVEVTSRATLERTSGFGSPAAFCFIEEGPSGYTFNIPYDSAPTVNTDFTLKAFVFPADLALGTDHNALTDHGILADALLNKAKALAYFAEDPTDKRGFACEDLYQRAYQSALYADARARIAGHSMHW